MINSNQGSDVVLTVANLDLYSFTAECNNILSFEGNYRLVNTYMSNDGQHVAVFVIEEMTN